MTSNRSQRVPTLEHWNGRKFRVVLPSKSFVEEAKKSRRVKDLLHNDVHKRGMLLCLAQTIPNICCEVANQKKTTQQSAVLSTPETLALGRSTGLNNTQMSELRSHLRNIGKGVLSCNKKELARIDHDVGLHNMPEAIFDSCTVEWAKVASSEKKPPETCSFWNGDILLEAATEIDMTMSEFWLVDSKSMTPPSLDYAAPGFEERPVTTVSFGGDHGQGACPCSLKINFSSPQERKERGDLSCRCPIIQMASIDCTKDSFELLTNTVMPQMRTQLKRLWNSCALVVCCTKNPSKHRKAFLVPTSHDHASIRIQHNALTHWVGMEKCSIDLSACFDMPETVKHQDLRVGLVVSKFNELVHRRLGVSMSDCWNEPLVGSLLHSLCDEAEKKLDAIKSIFKM